MTAPYIKAPGENLDYQFDWSLWLAGDTIVTSTWTVNGATLVTSYVNGAVTTGWISGGVIGASVSVENSVTTVSSRVGVRSFDIEIQEK